MAVGGVGEVIVGEVHAGIVLPQVFSAVPEGAFGYVVNLAVAGDVGGAAVAAVESKWTPVWRCWGALRIAEDSWATALEQGGDSVAAFAGLRVAYCGLLAEWPRSVVVPLAPVTCGRLP